MELAKQSTRALIQHAAEHGHVVTATQLARWHRYGILPQPEQHSLGKRGTESLYPSGTDHQVIALCELKRTERRLQHIAWSLWWSGFAVSLPRIREILLRIAEGWDQIPTMLVDPENGGLSEAAYDYVHKSEEARLDSGYLRRARKRVRRTQFPTFTRVLLEVAGGAYGGFGSGMAFPEERDQEATLLEDGLGLTRARIDRVDAAESWLQGEIEQSLQELSQLIGEGWASLLTVTSDSEIEQARNQARKLLEGLGGYLAMIGGVLGQDSFGITGIVDSFQHADQDTQALVLLFILKLQRTRLNEALGRVLATARQAKQRDEGACQVLEHLRRELPPFADILSPKTLRSACRSELAQQRHNEHLKQIAEEHRDALIAFWQRHAR